MAEDHTPDATPFSTEFPSAPIEDVSVEQSKVDAEIEASKVHWSDLASAYLTTDPSSSTSELEPETTSAVEARREWNLKVAEDNVHVFRSLQKEYPGGFFYDDDAVGADPVHECPSWMLDGYVSANGQPYEIRMSSEKPFAEGAQAELFHAHLIDIDNGAKIDMLVMKVFKEGTSLRDLLRLIPPTLLADEFIRTGILFGGYHNCNGIGGARLLKSSGRFAFVMDRAWGDLRKLIDVRMVHSNNQALPFANDLTIYIMSLIARGMRNLHYRDIVHRDLKAANVLVFGPHAEGNYGIGFDDPIHLHPSNFACLVADYECSVGVVGTGFWRAPEILMALKNGDIHHRPELFSKGSDVYSFGMTCYEIISGCIPCRELHPRDFDAIIRGFRPVLPSQTPPWMMDLVTRCWDKDPSMRPTFHEIVETLDQRRAISWWAKLCQVL